MPENWERRLTPQQSQRRSAKTSPRGSNDGQVRQARQPAQLDKTKRPTDLSGNDILNFISESFSESNIYTENQTFVNQFLQDFGTYITNNYDNSTLVQNFAGDIVTAITQVIEADLSDGQVEGIVKHLTESMLNMIAEYFEDNPNGNTTINNFIGDTLNQIAQYVTNNVNEEIINNYLTKVNGAQVFVQPDQPDADRVGTLWFDTDEPV